MILAEVPVCMALTLGIPGCTYHHMVGIEAPTFN
jgi:hypothetical protein